MKTEVCFLVNSKVDRRVKYTRMVLKESLMKLLNEKPINTITVKELCALADVNRSTFYSHYSDQYDLLSKIEEEIIHDMNDTLMSYNVTQNEDALVMIEKIVEYIAANSDSCRILLSENGDPSFRNRLMMIAHDYTMKTSMNQNMIIDEEMTEYASWFAVSGSIHVLESWLKNGMNKSPKQMAEMINHLINKGLASFKA